MLRAQTIDCGNGLTIRWKPTKLYPVWGVDGDALARIAKWWGRRHGYEARVGGWVYKQNGRTLTQGWFQAYTMLRHDIMTSDDVPSRGKVRADLLALRAAYRDPDYKDLPYQHERGY